MAVGDRIKRIRNMRGMTQKELGLAIGFDDKSADVRIAQYESSVRTPKEKMLAHIAHVLKVSPQALEAYDVDTYIGLAHTLFTLEDLYGMKVEDIDGELCITLDKTKGSTYRSIFDIFLSWHNEAEKLNNGEVDEDEYNTWRYNYPRSEAERFAEERKKLREANNADKNKP